ncbi:AMP-binding protein [Gordonia insulae]|uniref:Long-chain-fatty-acid--CoA ligase FadD13 n=1 Tax=Gordonia insulae TaxID=2420509 RepID=A0A3G8JKA3_9ACTN|nr:AMP-binding protein [Gordonia insulae]AZG45474.1 Long-chain-fatty-acid--CoA ligase FadD13 [Gordonia insulae]
MAKVEVVHASWKGLLVQVYKDGGVRADDVPAVARPDSFFQYADLNPDRIAVVEPGGTSHTFGELHRLANRISHALRAANIVAGDRVALLSPNCADFLAILLGAEQVGVKVVPVNYHLTAPEIAYIVTNSDSRLLLVHANYESVAQLAMATASLPSDRCLLLGPSTSSGRRFSDLIDQYSEDPPLDRVHGSVMMYTSGTTGRPKGVSWPSREVDPESAARALDPLMALRGMQHDVAAVSLVSGPLYHGAPLGWGTQALHHGHSLVLMDKWDSREFLRLVQRHGVTTAQLAPIHFYRLLQLTADERAQFDTSTLQVVSHSGAPTPVTVKRHIMEWLGPVLYEYYASTEGFGTSISPQDWLEHPGSVGRVDGNGADMQILDEDGNGVGAGVTGTLWIRNPGGLASEYFGDAEKTVSARRGEYFTTGDMAYIDGSGWLYLVDRRTDMILSGGVNIYPAEIEDVMRTHPAVDDVAVLGLPDEEWGQRVHAVVVPAAGHRPDDHLASEILGELAHSVAKYKVPKTVEFRDLLPYSASGKLLRRVLREDLAESE